MNLSIVIPTLNEEGYLPKLLLSIFAAAEGETEIIVVDGNSEDNTKGVVADCRRRAPEHVSVAFVQSGFRNVSHQRNLGGEMAKNKLLLFLDADTFLPPKGEFRKFLEAFMDKKLAVATCRFTPIEDDWRAGTYYNCFYYFQRVIKRISPYAMGACILTTKKIFMALHGFDTTIQINEDANFVNRASKRGPFAVIPIFFSTSARRFRHYGYFRTGLKYIYIFLYRTCFGEIRNKNIPYEFGKYT